MATIKIQTTKPASPSDDPMIALIVGGVAHLMSLAEAGRLEGAIQAALKEAKGQQAREGR